MTLPVRKKLRLENYDYSSDGYYFVTICTHNREKLFGKITNDNNTVELNPAGKIVDYHIRNIEKHYENIRIDKYTVMPNHIHLIVVIGCNFELNSTRNPNLSYIIGLFKSGVTKEIGKSVWQKRFHDHVIRNEKTYLKIWEYIDTNPLKWKQDIFYVD